MYSATTKKAIIWMCGSLSCLTLLAVVSRELTNNLPAFEILFWRSFLGLLIVGAIMCWQQQARLIDQIKTQQIGWHFVRNCAHFGGQYAWLLAIAAIPLTEVFALEFTTPLWSTLLASVFLAEKITVMRLVDLSGTINMAFGIWSAINYWRQCSGAIW